jgi:hypothetical protein
MRSLQDCPVPDGPSTPPDPTEYVCPVCDESRDDPCKLREYADLDDDLLLYFQRKCERHQTREIERFVRNSKLNRAYGECNNRGRTVSLAEMYEQFATHIRYHARIKW